MAFAYPSNHGRSFSPPSRQGGYRPLPGSNVVPFPGNPRPIPRIPTPKIGKGLWAGLAADIALETWQWYNQRVQGADATPYGYTRADPPCDYVCPNETSGEIHWTYYVTFPQEPPPGGWCQCFSWSNPGGSGDWLLADNLNLGFAPNYIVGFEHAAISASIGTPTRLFVRTLPATDIPQPIPLEVEEVEAPMPFPIQRPGRKSGPDKPKPLPPLLPWADPFAVPPLHPHPKPVTPPRPAIPDRAKPRPDRAPTEQPLVGPEPQPRPRPVVLPVPAAEVWPNAGTKHPPSHPPGRPVSPPPKGEKQIKVKGQIPPGLLRKIYDGITEANDFLDCLHKALPKSLRTKGNLTPQQKFMDVWRNPGAVNMSDLAKCVAENEVEDRFWGAIGRQSAKANQRLGVQGAGIGKVHGQGGLGGLNRLI